MSTFLLSYFPTFPSILQALYAKDEKIWQDQHQMSERFATSKPNISMYIANILKESGLYKDSVVKEYLTTAADGKNYNVVFYSLEMIIAVRWATEHLRDYLVKFFTMDDKRLKNPDGRPSYFTAFTVFSAISKCHFIKNLNFPYTSHYYQELFVSLQNKVQNNNMTTAEIKISELPEEIKEDGLKIYGPTSYETQIAILSHYLHTLEGKFDIASGEKRYEILKAIRDYIEYKRKQDKKNPLWEEVSDETIWMAAESPLENDLFADFFKVPFPAPENPKFTFIDLFAGMGGFRLAMQAQGGKCVFSSEWNAYSQKTYFSNFGDMPFGDITKDVTKSYIPKKFDVLCAGFPCQPFSIAGVSKKKSLGRETGFKDKTQGTLFFDVADIISRHRPKAFFLENVKNLTSHDKGNTFRVIYDTLRELRYSVHYLVMDGQTYVPQHRERIMIVGFDEDLYGGKEVFTFPEQHEATRSIKEILDPNIDPKYTLSDKLWAYLQNYAEKHRAKGNGFGYGLVDLNGITRTLSARYYKDGSEILIPQGEGKNPRRLSPRECARLMGYPDAYRIDRVSDVQAYRQCGNSVIVPLIIAVSEQIIKTMEA